MSAVAELADHNNIADQRIISDRYRPEIDGIRAIAVIAVIVNHFDRHILPYGYLGVDIFFVISGFVITSSIYYRPTGRFVSFWSEFYARRFKRIFPALAVCVLLTSLLICLVDPAPIASLRTGLASLFGLSNLYLLKQATDYFGTWAELNAFTHTWSLGVEEQFYLLFPLAVWTTRFRRGALITVVGAASMTSLIFYIAIAAKSQPESFFLLQSRLWELGLGVLLFSVTTLGSLTSRLRQTIPPSLLLILLVCLLFLKIEAQVPTNSRCCGTFSRADRQPSPWHSCISLADFTDHVLFGKDILLPLSVALERDLPEPMDHRPLLVAGAGTVRHYDRHCRSLIPLSRITIASFQMVAL